MLNTVLDSRKILIFPGSACKEKNFRAVYLKKKSLPKLGIEQGIY